MKTQLFIHLMIVFLFFTQHQVSAQKIYLSPSGDDTNSGTIEKPLATLTAARDKAREFRQNNQTGKPVEVIALEGEYFMFQPLDLTDSDGGTTDSPLVFKF